ncbi:MAG: circadian clock protein KaiC [Magnetococcus sp. YQC-5]
MKAIKNNTVLASASRQQLPKSRTGIQGLDEITGGGLPTGRPTLICGGAGCGKTLLAMEFLVRGARDFNAPGVFMAFEESVKDLIDNVASLGFDLDGLVAQGKLALDYVCVERSEIVMTGEYDLEGLFIRLGYAIDSIGAKRVVLDTIESLFVNLPNQSILRAELRRLFIWLKEKGVTAVITGERGDGQLTRHGLEEYVSDCVIVLDHRVTEQISTRRLRVAKYRGSMHSSNEYPFLINEDGFSILPITSVGLNHEASCERIATGISHLDQMLDGKGYHRGSSVLLSGTAGAGKSSVAAHFVEAACQRGERVLYFAFEESPEQIMRNMSSIGIDLRMWVQQGLCKIIANRPTFVGLEMHLIMIHKDLDFFHPQVVVMDPLSSFFNDNNYQEVKSMLMRLIDFLKMHQITALFISLTSGDDSIEEIDSGISSLIDSWLFLQAIKNGGEFNRTMHVVKARGIAHSNQIREFMITDQGVVLRDVYVGLSGVLTGSARLAQEAQDRAARLVRQQESECRRRDLERKRTVLEAQIAAMHAELAAQESEILAISHDENMRAVQLAQDQTDMISSRRGT